MHTTDFGILTARYQEANPKILRMHMLGEMGHAGKLEGRRTGRMVVLSEATC